MAKLLPIVLISPIAGVIVDRVSRKKVMIISDLLRCGVVLGFLLVEDQDALWLVYALVIIEISLSGFFEPARSAIIPSLVPKKDLVTANALSGSTWSVMLAFGAALGGVIVHLFGIRTAFILDASTFLLSAWFISRISSQEKINEKRFTQTNWLSGVCRFSALPMGRTHGASIINIKSWTSGSWRHHDPDSLDGQPGVIRFPFIGNWHTLFRTWIGRCSGSRSGQTDLW